MKAKVVKDGRRGNYRLDESDLRTLGIMPGHADKSSQRRNASSMSSRCSRSHRQTSRTIGALGTLTTLWTMTCETVARRSARPAAT